MVGNRLSTQIYRGILTIPRTAFGDRPLLANSNTLEDPFPLLSPVKRRQLSANRVRSPAEYQK